MSTSQMPLVMQIGLWGFHFSILAALAAGSDAQHSSGRDTRAQKAHCESRNA